MAIAAVATVATTAGLLPLAAVNAGAAANFDLTRFAGADRYDTAAKISAGTFTTATDVVVTTGENFPDALAGNYLAGNAAAPILLTQKGSVPATTQAEINRLKPQRVWVLGGTDAVGAAGVPQTSGTVTRIGGATRYETAAQAGSTGTVGTLGGLATAIIATGDKFADALSAGPAAFANHFPLFLTPGAPATALNTATKNALTARGIKHVILMGGTNAVSAAVESEIQAMGITTERAAGADRTETARNFAETILLAKLGFSTSHMNVARGDLFPDALSGGPHAGTEKAPILLTWTSTAATADGGSTTGVLKYASDHKATLTGGHIFGGTDAVSAAVEAAIEAAGGAIAGAASTTTLPELVAATIVKTVTTLQQTPTNPAGTTVQYIFDEPISAGSPVAANFKLYDYTNPNAPVTGTGGTATVDPTNANAVNVLFPALNTAASVANMSVAAVAQNAVTDLQAKQNPEGDAAVGTAHTISGTAGTTAAPDLLSIGNFRQAAASTQTAVDFVFDQPAFLTTTGTSGFHVILANGNDVLCTTPSTGDTLTPSGGTSPGGNGTTTITATCGDHPATPTTPYTSAQVARGTVDLDSVRATPAATTGNPLEASDTPHTASTSPRLVSATLVPSSTTTTGTILYTFDQPVGVAGANTAFHAYDSTGTQYTAVASPAVAPSTSNANQVAASFPNSVLAVVIGASVDDTAVNNTTTGANQQDEVGVSNANSTSVTPGRTAGPDLVAVTITAIKDIFGTTTGYSASYTFDQNIGTASTAPTTTPGSFFLWDADGTKLTCGAPLVYSGTSSTTTVTCVNWGGATLGQQQSAVLGTVAAGAVTDTNGLKNPEGANATTGGSGTPTV
jgi:putative cell wall-binding protein